MELTHILVVSDLQRSLAWYRDVLGATLTGEYGGTSAVFNYDGAWLLVVTPGGETADKPETEFVPPDMCTEKVHIRTGRVSGRRGAAWAWAGTRARTASISPARPR